MTKRVHILELRSVRGTGGGPEKTILLGAQRSDPRVAVTVCYIRDTSDAAFGVAERAGVLGSEYVEVAERGSFDPRIWGALRRIVRERGIDIVHAHDYKTDLLALMLGAAEGIQPLATAHGWTGHSTRERLFYYPLDKRVLRYFPVTIAVSSEIRRELLRCGAHPDRVRVVLNGIDQNVFRHRPGLERPARAQMGLSPDDVVIGAVGRLEPQKRFDLLIRACGELYRRMPSLRLVIVGSGSAGEELQAVARESLPRHAYRLRPHRTDVDVLHHGFDLFVQSSDYEGTPNAVLEAMALETPIVATAAGGTTDILEHELEGTIVPTGDVGALVAAMEHALADRERTRRQVQHARRRVETTLSFAARMRTVENIYLELAARGRPGIQPPAAAEECA